MHSISGFRYGGDARERIMLGAAIADLREALYKQQCLLLAILEMLDEKDLMDQAEALDRGRALSERDWPDLPLLSE